MSPTVGDFMQYLSIGINFCQIIYCQCVPKFYLIHVFTLLFTHTLCTHSFLLKYCLKSLYQTLWWCGVMWRCCRFTRSDTKTPSKPSSHLGVDVMAVLKDDASSSTGRSTAVLQEARTWLPAQGNFLGWDGDESPLTTDTRDNDFLFNGGGTKWNQFTIEGRQPFVVTSRLLFLASDWFNAILVAVVV